MRGHDVFCTSENIIYDNILNTCSTTTKFRYCELLWAVRVSKDYLSEVEIQLFLNLSHL